MMNQDQREYTIKKIDKNNEDIEKLGKKASSQAFVAGLAISVSTISATALGTLYSNSFLDEIAIPILSFIVGSGTFVSFDSLRIMVNNLAKKAGLEVMVEKLEYDLSMDSLESRNQRNDNEETKGRTR